MLQSRNLEAVHGSETPLEHSDTMTTTTDHESMSDFYPMSDYAPFTRECRVGGSFGVKMLYVEQQPHAFTDPPFSMLHFVNNVRGSGYAKFDFGDGWKEHPNIPQDSVDLQPAHQTCSFEIDHPHALLIGAISSDVVCRKLDEVGIRGDPFESLYGRLMGRTKQSALLRSMWRAMQTGGPADNIYIDGCVIALLGMFCAAADGALEWSPPVLEDVRLERVVDFIDAHFSEPIAMDDLSAVAGMSTIHFSRGFKKAVGVTPHEFLTRRRLTQAKVLLRSSNLSITEVAFASGFGSSAHFASVFSRKVGMTPSAYRSER